MISLYQKKVNKRVIILTFFLMLWACGLVLRLIQLQIIEHTRLKAQVIEQNHNTVKVYPERGTIFDREGNIMARSLPHKSVFYTPFKEESYSFQCQLIDKVKGVLGLSERELLVIKNRIKKNAPFIWVKRKINQEQEEKVKNLHLGGIHLLEENKRFYPHGKLAAHLLGRVDIDDIGASGVEKEYNSVLEGKVGKRLILMDAKRRDYRMETVEEPEPGRDIMLTVDETIQYIAEKELERAVLQSEANRGTVIIGAPHTGEILAMANYPTYDLNNPPQAPTLLDRNAAIHHLFEPGSTFKIVTASGALEAKSVNLDETFDCSKGFIFVAGKTIRDHHRFETLSFPEVIIHSSNVGTVMVGQRTGEGSIYKTIKAFGFGQRTGIDLPAEEKGIFRALDRWTNISVSSLSIGYEISVTALQMLQTINTIANRGTIIPPRIVKKILLSEDEAKEKPIRSKRVTSKETASTLISILQNVVQEGTGRAAQTNGYTVAGKTGTAQKYDRSIGGYSSTSHIASFVGFAPVENPALSIVVVIDEPKGLYYGGQVAAPVFREIASQVLRYLRIPRQRTLRDTIIAANESKRTE
ncbi:MAG: penicillin-binding protein 2 [Candidatus Aminicenantes bacterium]|nr:MAG: penicillin-binding protein 2 [Candidatus Aminicenantes bacterium]